MLGLGCLGGIWCCFGALLGGLGAIFGVSWAVLGSPAVLICFYLAEWMSSYVSTVSRALQQQRARRRLLPQETKRPFTDRFLHQHRARGRMPLQYALFHSVPCLCSFFEGELATCAAFVIGNPPPPPPPPAIPAMYFGAIAPPPPDAACRCLLLHAIAVGARDLLHALKRCGRRHPLSSSRHCCGLFSVVLRSDWAGMASMARARRGAWGFAPKWASGRA